MFGTRDYDVKQNKPDAERQILDVFFHSQSSDLFLKT
jgi:hypothetical protein